MGSIPIARSIMRTGALLLASVLARACLPACAAAQGQDNPSLLRQGHRFYYAGEHAKAMDAYTRVLLDDPQSLQALLNGAVVLAELGDRERTAQWLERALKASPADPEIRIALGEAHLRRNDLAAARKELESALASAPKDPFALLALARVELAQQKARKAQELLEDAVSAAPTLTLASYWLGKARESGGDPAGAVEAYRNAVLGDSYFTHARYQLGLAYLRVRKFHDAWRQLNPLLSADPRNTRFRKLLAGVSRGAIEASRPPPEEKAAEPGRPLALPLPPQEGRIPLLRVGLGANSAGKSLPRKEVFFRSSGGFAVVEAESGRVLARGEGELWRARAVSGGKETRIEVLDPEGRRKVLTRRPLRVRGESGQSVIVRNVPADYGGGQGGGDRPLRGEIEISLHPRKKALRLVNVLDLESYTHGVLAAEMPIGSPIEALKAQAVVARTHALFIKIVTQRHKSDGYDVCDGQHCQVYNGIRNESDRSRSIVEATRGRVVAFQGRIAHVLYSSNCAGHTQSGREVSGWGDVPYWTGVPDAPSTVPVPASPWELRLWLRRAPAAYCRASGYVHPSHFRWTRVVPAADLEERINRTCRIGKLTGLRTLQRSLSGHLNSVLVKGSKASRVVTQEIGIRALLGDGSQRSALFMVETDTDKSGKPRSFTFFGGGWGHAVGMCQSGAMGRAEAGQSYADILAAYYQGTELGDLRY